MFRNSVSHALPIFITLRVELANSTPPQWAGKWNCIFPHSREWESNSHAVTVRWYAAAPWRPLCYQSIYSVTITYIYTYIGIICIHYFTHTHVWSIPSTPVSLKTIGIGIIFFTCSFLSFLYLFLLSFLPIGVWVFFKSYITLF